MDSALGKKLEGFAAVWKRVGESKGEEKPPYKLMPGKKDKSRAVKHIPRR